MNINPELQRNLWLEFSAQRLAVMPLVLAAIFYLAFETGGLPAVAGIARWTCMALALLWGTRLAGDAVSDEVLARTWDWQRLSSLAPWTLTWGKLIGAPSYAWYGALLALGTFAGAATLDGEDPDIVMLRVALLLLASLCAHAVALLVSLHGVRRRDSMAAGRGLWGLIAGLLAAWPWIGLESDLGDGGLGIVLWYDRHWLGLDFGLASALLFTALAWLACYRSMRAELQQRNAPWVWLAGSLFLMAYAAGFVGTTEFALADGSRALFWWGGIFDIALPSLRLLVAMLVALLLTYAMALWEPKNGVLVARLRSMLARGEVLAAVSLLPRWCHSLALALVAGVAALLVSSSPPSATLVAVDPHTLVAALLLFAVRDLGLLVFLRLSSNPRRADLAWLIYLGVLYLLAPAVVLTAGLPGTIGWLLPRADLGVVAGALPVLVQVIAVVTAVLLRWRRTGAMPAASSPPD